MRASYFVVGTLGEVEQGGDGVGISGCGTRGGGGFAMICF